MAAHDAVALISRQRSMVITSAFGEIGVPFILLVKLE